MVEVVFQELDMSKVSFSCWIYLFFFAKIGKYINVDEEKIKGLKERLHERRAEIKSSGIYFYHKK